MHTRKQWIEVSVAVVVVALLVWLVVIFTRPVPTALHIGPQTITLQIADTDFERQLGLGGKSSLNTNVGMLFVFRKKDYYPFWMKGMRFPIDIVWLDEDFTVVDIAREVSPDSFPNTYSPEEKALYVLEINSGKSDEWGIGVGSQLTPVFTD